MAGPRRTSGGSESSAPERSQQELGSMYDYLAKVILLGPSGSGKSCLLHRFVKSEWRILSSQTIGVEFASKIVRIGTGTRKRRIKLQLWDTAGTERFRSVSRSYYRGAAGAVLVYDIGSRTSFDQLPTFLMDARALASPNLTMILVGNKADLAPGLVATTEQQARIASSVSSRLSIVPSELGADHSVRSRAGSLIFGTRWTATRSVEGRDVAQDTASRWASTSGVPLVVEVSAFSGEGVDELFNRLASMILTKIELGEINPDDPRSGIQYGDAEAADGDSIRSRLTVDDGGVRRQVKRQGAVGDWGEGLIAHFGVDSERLTHLSVEVTNRTQ